MCVQSVPLSVAHMFKAVNASASSTLNSLFPGVENSSAAKRKGKGKKEGGEGGMSCSKKKRKRKRGEQRKTVGGSERQSRRQWKECRDTLWCEHSAPLQYDSDGLM